MGTNVLFLNPVTYETEVVLDDFPCTVHELLVVPDASVAYVPIFGVYLSGDADAERRKHQVRSEFLVRQKSKQRARRFENNKRCRRWLGH